MIVELKWLAETTATVAAFDNHPWTHSESIAYSYCKERDEMNNEGSVLRRTCSPFSVVHLPVAVPSSRISRRAFVEPLRAFWLSTTRPNMTLTKPFPRSSPDSRFRPAVAADVVSTVALGISSCHIRPSVGLTPSRRHKIDEGTRSTRRVL